MATIDRLIYFDVMKGIAIILVVMGHIMEFSFGISPSEPVKCIYFNMPLFFYISGYLAYRNLNSKTELLRKIFRRGLMLLVPYIVFLSLYNIFSSAKLPSITQFISGGGRYWFLYTLFILSSFFMIYGYIIRKIDKNWLYVILLILPYIALVLAKVAVNQCDMGGGIENVISGLVNYYRYYLIGFLCKKYSLFNRAIFENTIIYAAGFVLYFLNWYFFDIHNMALIFLGTLGGIIVIQTFVRRFVNEGSRIGNLLMMFGKCSLGIYVIHYFFIPDISEMVSGFFDCGNPFILQFTCAIIVTVPIVLASTLIFKLIEMNRWLFLMFFGKKVEE